MNDREQFYSAFPKHAGVIEMAEAGSISMIEAIAARHEFAVWIACAESKKSELDKANKEVEYYLSAYKIAHKQAMDNGSARDKANARIAQLEKTINDNPPTIWLSEHDKAVEVKVLQLVLDNTTRDGDEEVYEFISELIESRK